jgi:hypothetical protein
MNEITLEISGCEFLVSETGEIQRKTKSGSWKTVKNTKNHNRGYNVIMINKKQYMRSRLMLLAFKDAFRQRESTEKIVMHHIDGNCLNCALSNLTVETYSSISYYRTDTSGFQYDPVKNTYAASITLNGELIQLGNFLTADEAHDKYIKTRNLLQERRQSN